MNASELQARRKQIGLTQKQVALAAGITGNNYARIERGEDIPSLTTFERIAAALGCEVLLVPTRRRR
jgi:transcriptional regulator with XRE-family HTH domain